LPAEFKGFGQRNFIKREKKRKEKKRKKKEKEKRLTGLGCDCFITASPPLHLLSIGAYFAPPSNSFT
jgi:hypothetical protein